MLTIAKQIQSDEYHMTDYSKMFFQFPQSKYVAWQYRNSFTTETTSARFLGAQENVRAAAVSMPKVLLLVLLLDWYWAEIGGNTP